MLFGLDFLNFEDVEIIYIGNILYIIIEVFVGVVVDVGLFINEENDFFSILGFDGGGLVVFFINGNFMEFVINDNDIVVSCEIVGVYEIRDNKIYVVKNNGFVWVKYVQCILNEKGWVIYFKLILVNYLEYDFFIEEVNEYICLYEVVWWVSLF